MASPPLKLRAIRMVSPSTQGRGWIPNTTNMRSMDSPSSLEQGDRVPWLPSPTYLPGFMTETEKTPEDEEDDRLHAISTENCGRWEATSSIFGEMGSGEDAEDDEFDCEGLLGVPLEPIHSAYARWLEPNRESLTNLGWDPPKIETVHLDMETMEIRHLDNWMPQTGALIGKIGEKDMTSEIIWINRTALGLQGVDFYFNPLSGTVRLKND